MVGSGISDVVSLTPPRASEQSRWRQPTGGAASSEARELSASLTGPHRKPEEHVTTRRTSCTRHTAGPTLEESAAPNRTLTVGTSSALSDGPRSQTARTHAISPEAHLELDDRLADHREQPRRQRDQLRRELRVRHTSSDRRRRLPVPREQHHHEHLEPLQQHLRLFAHECSSRQEKEGRRALPKASAEHCSLCTVPCVPRWRYTPRVRHEYSVSGR